MTGGAGVLESLIEALSGVGARYLIGGSVASSAIGLPRATLDTDILVEIGPGQIVQLAKTLGKDWYMDAEFATKALEQKHAFNAIHMASGYKFDFFPACEPFHQAELSRAVRRQLRIDGGNVACLVATAEDILLAKLKWYRDGGEVSERQWSDIEGILTVGRNLDTEYLHQWAPELGVGDLLERAMRGRLG
jgi:hypothetical protein